MTYISPFSLWGPRGNQVAVLPPSYGDLFVLTTVLGRRVFLDPISHYDAAVRRAHDLADRLVHPEPVVIKVLSITNLEACKVQGIDPATLFADQTPEQEAEVRQQIVTSMTQLLRTSSDPRVRADALKLLTDLGAIP
jgi:hypothetical protein